VCFCLDVFFIGLVWVSSVVHLPLFLSLLCRNGSIGLRETHAGLLQTVSDFSTAALFPLGCVLCFVFCVLWFLICVFRCCCVCGVRCCVAIVGVGVAECGWCCCLMCV